MEKGDVKQIINDQLTKFIEDVEMEIEIEIEIEIETNEDNEYIIQCAEKLKE